MLLLEISILKKSQTLKNPKKKDLLKIIKDVQNNVSFLQREMPKIEKEYQKFINERKPKIKELENKNKKMVKEFNNINKRLNVYNQYQTLLKEKENQRGELELKTIRLRKQQENLEQIIKSSKKQRQVVLNNIENIKKQRENQYQQDAEIELLTKEFEEKKYDCLEHKRYYEDQKNKCKNIIAQLEEENKKIEKINNEHNYVLGKYQNISNAIFDELKDKIDVYKNNRFSIEDQLKEIKKFEQKILEEDNHYNALNKEEAEHYEQIIQKYKTKKYIPYDIWSLNRQNSSLLEYITNMEYQMKSLKKNVEKLLLSHNKMTNEISDIRDLSNKVIGISLYEQYCKQVNKLQKQISKNQNQIDKLNQEIGVENQKYNNIKNAYNRAFGLYQSQQNKINNKCVYGCKLNIVNQK